MGLVNKVVPADQLEEEVAAWCKSILEKSPTAIRCLKASFNAQAASSMGNALIGDEMTWEFWNSEEAFEGRDAFDRRRTADFSRFRE